MNHSWGEEVDKSVVGKSYYELAVNPKFLWEVFSAAGGMTVAMKFMYQYVDWASIRDYLIESGYSECTAHQLLNPTPYFAASIVLLLFFMIRTAAYRPLPSDWSAVMGFINQKEDYKDLFNGKALKRSRRFTGFVMSVLMFPIAWLLILMDVAPLYSGDCRSLETHMGDQPGFSITWFVMITPTFLYYWLRLLISKE